MNDRDLQEAHYQRFLNARKDVVSRLHQLAKEIEEVPENDHRDRRREPAAIISQVTHMLLWGVANLGLDRMASWADSVYEIRTYEAANQSGQGLCGYSIDDPHTVCVLGRGHTLPDNGGLVHVSAEGVHFA